MNRTESLKTRIMELSRVSTIPLILRDVISAVEDEKTTPADLERIITKDQAISSRIISMANSPYYGLPRRVSNLTQAIVVLGFDTIKSLAITITVFRNLSSASNFDIRDLWAHSLKVAMVSSLIAGRTGLVNKETAFLTGLLHDIGKALLFQIFEEEYCKVSAACGSDDLEREREAFGADHPLVGAWFAEKCRLPEECINAIRFHHSPNDCRPADSLLGFLAPVIHTADHLASTEDGQDGSIAPTLDPGIAACLKLDSERYQSVNAEVRGMDGSVRNIFFA